MKELEQLLAEREALTDKLLAIPKGGHEEEFYRACNEAAMHFLRSLEIVLNPIQEPLSFLAIFALRHFADMIAKRCEGAEEIAKEYSTLVDVDTTMISYPHVKKTEDDEEEDDEDDGTADV